MDRFGNPIWQFAIIIISVATLLVLGLLLVIELPPSFTQYVNESALTQVFGGIFLFLFVIYISVWGGEYGPVLALVLLLTLFTVLSLVGGINPGFVTGIATIALAVFVYHESRLLKNSIDANVESSWMPEVTPHFGNIIVNHPTPNDWREILRDEGLIGEEEDVSIKSFVEGQDGPDVFFSFRRNRGWYPTFEITLDGSSTKFSPVADVKPELKSGIQEYRLYRPRELSEFILSDKVEEGQYNDEERGRGMVSMSFYSNTGGKYTFEYEIDFWKFEDYYRITDHYPPERKLPWREDAIH